MRMLANLKEPLRCNPKDLVYKIVLHEIDSGVYVYLYTSPDAVLSSFDMFYEYKADALEDWQDAVGEWQPLDDPLPYCQHDALLPIRVKGRDTGSPKWGEYEILKDGKWIDYKPN